MTASRPGRSDGQPPARPGGPGATVTVATVTVTWPHDGPGSAAALPVYESYTISTSLFYDITFNIEREKAFNIVYNINIHY